MKSKIILYFIFILSLNSFSQIQIGNDILGVNANDKFGESVSMSTDGNIVAIGTPRSNNFKGNVKVFKNINDVWTQIGTTINGNEEFGSFGRSISLSSNGNILAIGIPFPSQTGKIGKVQLYKNINDVWTQIGNDILGVNGDDVFGLNVDLSSNGNIVAIASQNNDAIANDSGLVRVFENIGENWVQKGNDINGSGLNNYFGRSLTLSADGTTFAIGTLNNAEVAVYRFNDNNWLKIGNNILGSALGGLFGEAIDLSADGNFIAISDPQNKENSSTFNKSGAVRIYKNISNSWTQIGSNINGNGENDSSGQSVSISADGNVVAIGSTQNSKNAISSGEVRIFQNIDNNWTQIGNDINGENNFEVLGYSLSLSSNGEKIAIGAPGNSNTNGNFSGSVKVYDLKNVLSIDKRLNSVFFFNNPVSNFINLKSNYVINNIQVYSLNGKLITSKNINNKEVKVDLTKLNSGLYLLKIKSNNKLTIKKILKN